MVKVLQRHPALMIGGWQAWRAAVAASPVRAANGLSFVGFGNIDGVQDQNDPSPPPNNPVLPNNVTIHRSVQDYVSKKSLGKS